MAQISHLIRVKAKPGQVYARVASTAGITAWFTKASSSSYEQGGTLELHFGDQTVTFTITELIPESRVVWRCTTADNPWFETDVVFEFEPRGTATTVRFDHLGWSEVSDHFRDCSMSWAYFLESLRALIEDGRGTPE